MTKVYVLYGCGYCGEYDCEQGLHIEVLIGCFSSAETADLAKLQTEFEFFRVAEMQLDQLYAFHLI